jgi:hypothetical protein
VYPEYDQVVYIGLAFGPASSEEILKNSFFSTTATPTIKTKHQICTQGLLFDTHEQNSKNTKIKD